MSFSDRRSSQRMSVTVRTGETSGLPRPEFILGPVERRKGVLIWTDLRRRVVVEIFCLSKRVLSKVCKSRVPRTWVLSNFRHFPVFALVYSRFVLT